MASRIVVVLALLSVPPQDVSREEAEKIFAAVVHPVLKAKCLGCHGDDPKKLKGGLDLLTRETMLKGGDSGEPPIVPGKPAASPMIAAIERKNDDLKMPPKDRDKLTAAEVDAFRRWIAGGAPWVASKDPWAGSTPADRWAFYPIAAVKAPGDAAHPVDAFLLAKLKDKGLRPAGEADRRTLIRRATMDLTGLPPTAQEMETNESYEKIVDRLLASPAYGEQWARHWLDVVRYADTSGFSNDFERPHAWRYRDYIVRSLNKDKPFDRFILEQIAGDELGEDPELLVAAGFLRMGPWEHTAMSVAALTRQHFLDDVTHATAATFLGLTMRCARCHDHKFDPLPTRDYYRLQAVFASTQFAERPAPFLPEENTAGFDEGKALGERRLKEKGYTPIGADDEKTRRGLEKVGVKRKEHLSREILRFEPLAFSVYDGPLRTYVSNQMKNGMPKDRSGKAQEIAVLRGGALEAPGEMVAPGVLTAIRDGEPVEVPESLEGRRLALARWIASPKNPFTARVIVNRVWQHHFGGKGIVATPNNFGKMGKRPTHPELLDWLAGWFIDNGWSLKKLHRLILTSEAYRRAGAPPDPDAFARLDPSNDLLSVYPARRLAAEEIRDAMLAVSGELRPDRGGPGIFPEINWEVALQPRHVMGGPAPAYQPSPRPEERHRRTLYAYRTRTLADPMLEVFNRPGTEMSCERRDETTVTPQAFALFNGQFAHDRALALADRATKSRDAIDFVFRAVYGRAPAAEERDLCARHLGTMTAHHDAHPPVKVEVPTTVRREMIEEFTGEVVRWDEELDLLKNYKRDLKPWDVAAPTRALADVCLVLFNSNEFLYLR